MPCTLSNKVQAEVKRLLPELRKQVVKEFYLWEDAYFPNHAFFSDDAVMQVLPIAAQHYIILNWGITPERVDKRNASNMIEGKAFKDLPKITEHALRLLALEVIFVTSTVEVNKSNS